MSERKLAFVHRNSFWYMQEEIKLGQFTAHSVIDDGCEDEVMFGFLEDIGIEDTGIFEACSIVWIAVEQVPGFMPQLRIGDKAWLLLNELPAFFAILGKQVYETPCDITPEYICEFLTKSGFTDITEREPPQLDRLNLLRESAKAKLTPEEYAALFELFKTEQ